MAALPRHWFSIENSNQVLFPFHTLEGDLLPCTEQIEDVSYNGVDGKGYWLIGKRGEPFTISTSCDYQSTGQCNSIRRQYESWCGKYLKLYYAQQPWELVIVRKVVTKRLRRASTVKGGFNVPEGSSGFLLDATWTIEAQPQS